MLEWGRLFQQWRCRAIWVSWTEEDLKKIVVDWKIDIQKAKELQNEYTKEKTDKTEKQIKTNKIMTSLFETTTYITTEDLKDSSTICDLSKETELKLARLIITAEEFIDNYIVWFLLEREDETQLRIFPARFRWSDDTYEIPLSIQQACVIICEIEYVSWFISSNSFNWDIIREKVWDREVEFWNIPWIENLNKLNTALKMLDAYKCSNFNFTL